MQKHGCLRLLGGLFLLMISSAFSETINIPNEKTFTLYQISNIDTVVLRGKNSTQTFYIPLPALWNTQSLDLSFMIRFSPIFQSASTLTLTINDIPIDTIKLDSSKEESLNWKVTIPKQYIKNELLTVRIIGYMKISENACQDMENEGNWLTISGNSTVTYHFLKNLSPIDLSKFPYPFIQKDTPFKDKITFILPEKPNFFDVAPYFQLTNIFTRYASWRGVDYQIDSIEALKNGTVQTNALLVGTPETIDFSQFNIHYPLLLSNNRWIENKGRPLANGVGFIFLTPNPKNPTQSLLIISANDWGGINTMIQNLFADRFKYEINKTSFFIARPFDLPQTTRIKNSFSLKDLGYNDTVVFGNSQNRIDYQFNLPASLRNDDGLLVLNYSNSPFLDTNSASYLMVQLNDLPINGVKLDPNSAQQDALEVNLPKEKLKPGKNSLSILFDLHLEEQNCSRYYLSRAWGTIYDSSYFTFTKTDTLEKVQLKYYPYLLSNEILVVLPSDDRVYQNKQFLLELFKFSTTLNTATSLTMSNDAAVTKSEDTHQDLIYLATAGSRPLLTPLKTIFQDLQKNLNITTNKSLKSIDRAVFKNAFTSDQNVGFAGIDNSSITNKVRLFLYGYTGEDLTLILSLMNDAYKLNFLSGNLAVAFKNGTYTNLSSSEINEQVHREVEIEKTGEITLKTLLFGGGGLLILIFVVLFIRSTRNKNT